MSKASGDPGLLGLAAEVVAVVEGPGPPLLQLEHGFDVGGHGRVRPADVVRRVLFPERQGLRIGQAVGDIAVELVVGRGLVGQDVGREAPAHELRQDVGRVAEQGDRKRGALLHGLAGQAQRLVETVGHRIDVAGLEPPLDAVRIDLDDDGHAVVHGHGQRLGPAHASEPGRQGQAAPERAAEMPPGRLGQGLIGPLQDALRPDVDPAAGGHLAVHGQAQRFEAPELVPVGPLGDHHGIGDEDARRLGMGFEHGHGLARLHDERLVVLELLQAGDDGPVGLPVPGGLSGAAVDDELGGLLGHLGVEIVHEHPQRRFLGPALGRNAGPPRGPDIQDRFIGRLCHFLSPLRRFARRIYHSGADLIKSKNKD